MDMILEKITNSLLDLNNYLYNYVSHLIILVLWIAALVYRVPHLTTWFAIGLVIWVLLFLWRMYQDNFSISVLIYMWNENKGPLSFLVGLNLCVVLSLLSFPIIFLLAYVSRKQEQRKKNERKT